MGHSRTYDGPAVLKQGFRPFFMGAAVWAVVSLTLWVGVLVFGIDVPVVSLLDWHVHEMLFGYTGAVIAGFLLTAVPNWTGRLPISGLPLLGLFLLWLAGRAAWLVSADLNVFVVAAVDISFPTVLALAIARELIRGDNAKNMRVLVLVFMFILANLLFHFEVWTDGAARVSTGLGLSAVLLLIMLIGGRIVPSFTRNWLAKRAEGRLPVPFGRFDGVTIAVSAAALLLWSFESERPVTAVLLLLAGALNLIRLARWAGDRTFRDPLVIVLHIGYAFVPLGFFAVAASIAFPGTVQSGAGIHLWTAGAIGMMTMAVMTRASLGHTGQDLRADWRLTGIYAALFLSVVLRFAAGIGGYSQPLIVGSAVAWGVAYLGFVVRFWPLLIFRR